MSSSFSSAKREYLPLQQHTSSPSARRAIESSRSEPSGGQNSTSPSLHWTVAYPAPPLLHRLLASRLQLYSILVCLFLTRAYTATSPPPYLHLHHLESYRLSILLELLISSNCSQSPIPCRSGSLLAACSLRSSPELAHLLCSLVQLPNLSPTLQC